MRTCGLSHQIKGPTTVKLAKTGFNCKIVKFTITGPLIWCDNPQVRMSKILYINNNNFHHLGRSQMCAGGCYVFRTSKPHSGTLCTVMSTQVCALIFSILIMYILHWHFQVETSCLIKHLSLIVAQYILVSSNYVNIEKLQKRHTDWGASQRHLSLHSTLHQINLTQKYPSM